MLTSVQYLQICMICMYIYIYVSIEVRLAPFPTKMFIQLLGSGIPTFIFTTGHYWGRGALAQHISEEELANENITTVDAGSEIR